MSKGETSGDAKGWKRGEKGYASNKHKGVHRQWGDAGPEFLGKEDYKKELLEVKAVGQVASVGDGRGLKQGGY